MKKTLVIGASPKEDRYSNKAAKLLLQKGHDVELIGNKESLIENQTIHKDWSSLNLTNVNTVTMYVGVRHQEFFFDKIVALNPERVIFNQGTENPIFYQILAEKGIAYEEACTLGPGREEVQR